jgi:hypothetical protein
MKTLAVALSGLTVAFGFAFAVSFLDTRTPWWGHVIFGAPAILAALGFVWAARRHVGYPRS